MKVRFEVSEKTYEADLSKPISLAIPLRNGPDNPKAWFAPNPDFFPVETDDFIGSVKKGSPVNFFNVFFNPHGNGTHTETVGHISPEQESINQHLTQTHFIAQVLSVEPTELSNGDHIIHFQSVLPKLSPDTEALVLRTLPNDPAKKLKDYSGTNPIYLQPALLSALASRNIKHLLVDLPSVDREEDGGKLEAHKAFWQYPDDPRYDATITEFIFVPDEIEDGLYLINLQVPPLELDAAPSRPILFAIKEV